MATINASTKISLKKKPVKKTPVARGKAPPLQPSLTEISMEEIPDIWKQCLGEGASFAGSAPRAASTTRDRGQAAANIVVAAKKYGVQKVLMEQEILTQVHTTLLPNGLNLSQGLRPSASALSLSSMDNDTATAISAGTDSKRGKTLPPQGREGCLLLVRALAEGLSVESEPFLVGGLLWAALDECASSSGALREAASDAVTALLQIANPWALDGIVVPLICQILDTTTEWRCRVAALDGLKQIAKRDECKRRIHALIPQLIPVLTSLIWDTKPQVSQASKKALLSVCQTNTNPDIKPAVPAIVQAIATPADTHLAVNELMATTFVVPVDASTLSMLCPILARALKEKLALRKREACLVITNMSKLVESPEAVAPFGSLLVPELKRVSENVQFTEIRDQALSALAQLTKALGDLADKHQVALQEEQNRVEEEQRRIQEAAEEEKRKQTELERKEAEERRRFKEAMEAQRQLQKLEQEEVAKRKQEEDRQKEAAKLSTKGKSGKCQACGLKKCKKTCMFYGSK